jgi:hypothetical protein
MMMKFKYPVFLPIFILSLILSCKKGSSPNPGNTLDVYVAGSVYPSGDYSKTTATFWKNGVATSMPVPGSVKSWTNAISVHGTDVYVAGNIISTNSNTIQAMVWKNGVATLLTSVPSGGEARAIAISGNDVYIAGYSRDANNHPVATYWKNGVKTVIGEEDSEASAIAVQGSDVYMAGNMFVYDSPNSGNQWAAIWKNGVITLLNSNNSFNATGIALNGSDIYVSGNIVYWKNSIETKLSDSSKDVNITSMVVNGSDIYLGGTTTTRLSSASMATYWKNGVPAIPSEPGFINVSGIAVNGQDIYLAGVMDHAATLWKNGKPVQLSPNSSASSVTLVSR